MPFTAHPGAHTVTNLVTCDANEAVARVAYHLSDVIAIYPITPASPMGEWADQWASEGRLNAWGAVPTVVEMQSEAGAAGALHGALMGGSMATTFTSSQGLLLMLPIMYKMAGELTPAVFHVAARSIATHALSIFGDHSDAMAARITGWAMLCSASVQEAHDMAAIAHGATLEARLPILHFFDGFRTSHEIKRVHLLAEEDMAALVEERHVRAHRGRGLDPDHPRIRGTAQNPDVFFQAREAANPWYDSLPAIVQSRMDTLAARTGRHYRLFDYTGAPNAERVIVVMGSGARVVEETVEWMVARGERVGVVNVRLFRPFSVSHFLDVLPPSVRVIGVLDRCKEPGAIGEPLYQDVATALYEGWMRRERPLAVQAKVLGGRYGLSSKDFTPAMVRGVFAHLANPDAHNHFTVGINDDVTFRSISYDPSFSIESPETFCALFYGLGADGTVGANKNSIKIMAEEAGLHAQGYFVYDSRKSGAMTVSHLRFGPNPIESPYLVSRARFIACHQWSFLDRVDVLAAAEPGATVLLNCPYSAAEVWDHLPRPVQERLIERRLRLYVIDAARIAREHGLKGRINTTMQVCFFALTDVLPVDFALAAIRKSIHKSYIKRGQEVVNNNLAAVDAALAHLAEVHIPAIATSTIQWRSTVAHGAPDYVANMAAAIIAGRGDELPVSAMPPDGSFPSATTRWEKRALTTVLPVWDENLCIQCGKCVVACPHSVIRARLAPPEDFAGAPEGFKTAASKFPSRKADVYTIQISPDDCTGCTLCAEVCPVVDKANPGHKALDMVQQLEVMDQRRAQWDFFQTIPATPRGMLDTTRTKDVQLLEPLFEFPSACAGCGETPYLRILSQLFGDRALIANATGCSSIFGGNLPTTPWATGQDGRGPAWANSLFEDNAEFGLGFRLSMDRKANAARRLLERLAPIVGVNLTEAILNNPQRTAADIARQRDSVAALSLSLAAMSSDEARMLSRLAGHLVRRSVWIVGGDGWACDIGFGGLDHVLSLSHDVNILVLDTEVYSNTGGQASKSTPRGAVARFAAAGKPGMKKDLTLHALSYGHVYTARVALGANDAQALKVFTEAEAYEGPSLIVAYSHCVAHGYDLCHGMDQQKLAVASGHWPLFRYHPTGNAGQPLFTLDSRKPTGSFREYALHEARYRQLAEKDPARAEELFDATEHDIEMRWRHLEEMAARYGRSS